MKLLAGNVDICSFISVVEELQVQILRLLLNNKDKGGVSVPFSIPANPK